MDYLNSMSVSTVCKTPVRKNSNSCIPEKDGDTVGDVLWTSGLLLVYMSTHLIMHV